MPRPRFVYWTLGFFDIEDISSVVVYTKCVQIYMKNLITPMIQLDGEEAKAFLELPYFKENMIVDLRKKPEFSPKGDAIEGAAQDRLNQGGESAATN